MISFFRKIRLSLFSQNRVTRYLAYAAGEIILVTIGILIALQINTWKEERANRHRETTFYKSILIDLENDQQKLESQTIFYQNRMDNLTWFLSQIRNPAQPISSVDFGKHTEPLYYNESAISFDATFEAAKSAGAFDNFSNKPLLKQLVEYYTNFKQFEDVLTSILRIIENSFEPLMAGVPNSFLAMESAEQILINEGNKGFYSLLESIKDERGVDPQKEINSFLQKTEFESYVIGDLGRTFNMIEQLEVRTMQLKALKEEINRHLHD
ncbi:DUF6090 family protein [Algoriphagus sp. CAU 1675]|uniref:DUF6090 family protein n=1 Tax=Algoriphagus sp. CAU 1675 TaxID=3032597 RepID=UPI0023D9EFBF|nr:DUF6090 family protein [Algoriphagus sp. CAU 1675]MDF2156746.1 DUF6090 family protein [Algoriphagus sp. CAU 1675]